MKPLLKQQSIKGRGLAVQMIESPKSLDAGSIPSPRAHPASNSEDATFKLLDCLAPVSLLIGLPPRSLLPTD